MTTPTWHKRFFRAGWMALLLGMGLSASLASPAALAASSTCTDRVLETEKRLHIPRGLLLAIALVESGGSGTPQAFALNVRGRSVVARNTREAAKFLRDGKGKVRDNVYVGCMQLSLEHHRSAFQPVERIAEPTANIVYAGRLLTRLRAERGSWSEAVGFYNGGGERQRSAYMCKVRQNMLQLDGANARILDGSRCESTVQASIAPGTRRAFRASQVASTN